MINNVPNDSVQALVTQDEGNKRIIMKIQGALVYILCKISPEIYESYVRFDHKNKENILYVRILRDLYGMLIASLLYYKKF